MKISSSKSKFKNIRFPKNSKIEDFVYSNELMICNLLAPVDTPGNGIEKSPIVFTQISDNCHGVRVSCIIVAIHPQIEIGHLETLTRLNTMV